MYHYVRINKRYLSHHPVWWLFLNSWRWTVHLNTFLVSGGLKKNWGKYFVSTQHSFILFRPRNIWKNMVHPPVETQTQQCGLCSPFFGETKNTGEAELNSRFAFKAEQPLSQRWDWRERMVSEQLTSSLFTSFLVTRDSWEEEGDTSGGSSD